jgi:hypothetical protein
MACGWVLRRVVVWLQDVDLVQEALAYYRLMVVWLTGLVGGFRMPLPAVCPMEFASMPEHFVEDAVELLLFASRIPRALDGVNLVSLMTRMSFSHLVRFQYMNRWTFMLWRKDFSSLCEVGWVG